MRSILGCPPSQVAIVIYEALGWGSLLASWAGGQPKVNSLDSNSTRNWKPPNPSIPHKKPPENLDPMNLSSLQFHLLPSRLVVIHPIVPEGNEMRCNRDEIDAWWALSRIWLGRTWIDEIDVPGMEEWKTQIILVKRVPYTVYIVIYINNTVDGWNPAPPGMYEAL